MRVERCFGFVDLCGFTAFTERHGDETTVAVLAQLRTTLREVAARRGVRIVKWLGDGAMLSATAADGLVGLVLEVRQRLTGSIIRSLELRVGLDHGPVIMFEGDDYIGRPVNRASRLCDAAEEGQVLATLAVAAQVPAWVVASPVPPVLLPGFAEPTSLVALDVACSTDAVVDPVCGLAIPAAHTVLGSFCSHACAGEHEAAVG